MTVSRVCYCTREAVKRATILDGPDQNSRVDRVIQAESRKFETDTRTWFIPRLYSESVPSTAPLATYRYPYALWLPGNVWSVSSVVIQTQGQADVSLASTDWRFMQPGPPYSQIQLWPLWPLEPWNSVDVAINTDDYFPPSTVVVTGEWTRAQSTASVGTLVGAINDSVTSLVCSDASLVGVGDSLLLGAEQILVADRSLIVTTAALASSLSSDLAQQAVRVNDGDLVHVGEVIYADGERMYVQDVSGDTLIVQRQFDGSVLAAHEAGASLSVDRRLTVVRAQGQKADGTGGTTAASHSDGASILAYRAPEDVSNAVLAKSIATIQQEIAGYGRTVGSGEGTRPYSGKAVLDEWGCAVRMYKRSWSIA